MWVVRMTHIMGGNDWDLMHLINLMHTIRIDLVGVLTKGLIYHRSCRVVKLVVTILSTL